MEKSKQILVAPNAFKNSLSSIEAASVIAAGLKSLKLNLSVIQAPIADGGDGTLEVCKYHFKKSRYITCLVHDPLMRKIKSSWLYLNKNTALIELSKASGLALLNQKELNPLRTNTIGTGELILDALNKKCKKIILTIGGSATLDAGFGILYALGAKFYDKDRKLLMPNGFSLHLIKQIDLNLIDKRIFNVQIIVLCDVQNPFYGKDGSIKYATQKGADKSDLMILNKGIKNISVLTKKLTSKKSDLHLMTGDAGGVAFGMKAFLGAKLTPGFSFIESLISLEQKIRKSGFIISGEGSLDKQTISGKGVYELGKLAYRYKKPVAVFCGTYDKKIIWKKYNLHPVIQLKTDNMPISYSIKNVRKLLKKSIINKHQLFIKH